MHDYREAKTGLGLDHCSATTRTTLTRLTSLGEPPMPDGGVDNTVYQEILAAFTTGNGNAMRAKGVCRALGIGTEHKDIEGVRARLKRLVKRRILTETQPGLFALVALHRAEIVAPAVSWYFPFHGDDHQYAGAAAVPDDDPAPRRPGTARP